MTAVSRKSIFVSLVILLSALHLSAAENLKIVGYHPLWANVGAVQYEKLTHIMCAFALPQIDGSLKFDGSESGIPKLVSGGHAKGTKVGIAIGGWGAGTTQFTAIAGTPTLRAAFIKNVMTLIEKYDLDGADIDWEYPTSSGAANFAVFMTELGAALHAKGKFLSMAVIGGDAGTAKGVNSTAAAACDFINIMAYDAEPPHSTTAFAEECANLWITTKKVPAEKVILGVPFYASNDVSYASIVKTTPAAANCPVDQEQAKYGKDFNSIPTIKAKTAYAVENCGGIMIWELSYDAPGDLSLLSAISSAMGSSVIPRCTLTVASADGKTVITPNRTIFQAGDTVTLSAVPEEGGTFTGWSGDLSSKESSVKLVMNKNSSVNASFTKPIVQLSYAQQSSPFALTASSLTLPEPGRCRITVYSLTGRKIMEFSRNFPAGVSPISIEEIGKGTFIIQAESAEKIASVKFTHH